MTFRPFSKMLLLILFFARMRESLNAMVRDDKSQSLSKFLPAPLHEWSPLSCSVMSRYPSGALLVRNDGDADQMERSTMRGRARKYALMNGRAMR